MRLIQQQIAVGGRQRRDGEIERQAEEREPQRLKALRRAVQRIEQRVEVAGLGRRRGFAQPGLFGVCLLSVLGNALFLDGLGGPVSSGWSCAPSLSGSLVSAPSPSSNSRSYDSSIAADQSAARNGDCRAELGAVIANVSEDFHERAGRWIAAPPFGLLAMAARPPRRDLSLRPSRLSSRGHKGEPGPCPRSAPTASTSPTKASGATAIRRF